VALAASAKVVAFTAPNPVEDNPPRVPKLSSPALGPNALSMLDKLLKFPPTLVRF
jgi:hypothetical protein